MLHHIAIATDQIEIMSQYYLKLPMIQWKENKFTQDGELRSVWLTSHSDTIIMLEKFPYKKAPEALIFSCLNPETSLPYNLSVFQNQFIKKTDYTFYLLDPDGNTIGFSSYPKNLIEIYPNNIFY